MIPEHVKRKERIGLALLIVGSGIGFLIVAVTLIGELLRSPIGLLTAFALALPACLVYLTFPRLLDRYDPEPWYALVGCLVWGGFAATGFSIIPNSVIGGVFGDAVGAVVSAPIVEEAFKGLGVLGVFYFLRREFDGIVDGIIYASFVALGFAAIENVLYYARAMEAGMGMQTFVMRGILFPWGHPVYTAMTGIGLGLAREGKSPAVRMISPILGYCGAVFLHFVWNFSATFAQASGGLTMIISLPIWFFFVIGFFIMVLYLVRRRGQTVRQFLEDEVAIGNISAEERDLIGHPFGTFIARRRFGRLGVDFVRAGARLALSKWHSTRAQQENKGTVSMTFIVPLRNRMRQLRQEFLQKQAQQHQRRR